MAAFWRECDCGGPDCPPGWVDVLAVLLTLAGMVAIFWMAG